MSNNNGSFKTPDTGTFYVCAEGISICGERTINQDRFFIDYYHDRDYPDEHIERAFRLGESLLCFAIADGVGGAAKGEKASRIALESLDKWKQSAHNYLKGNTNDEMLDFIMDGFNCFNQKIVDFSYEIMENSATTLTLLLFYHGMYYLASVGDSPAFLFRRTTEKMPTMLLLTEPQTKGADIKKSGRIATEKENNILTAYLGNFNKRGEDMMNLSYGQLEDGDVFLLCSDGITKELSLSKIEGYVDKTESPLNAMFSDLEHSSPKDNCTAIIVSVKREGR